MAATNKANPARRKPLQSAPERPDAPTAQFPMLCPIPRQTAPQEATVMVCETCKDAVRLRVLPAPAAVRGILNETYGPMGWAARRYFADGRLWCAVGVFNPYMNDYCFKDAAALTGTHPGSDDRWKENSSFLAAAALWGAGSDVMALPPILLRGDQVAIVGITKPGKTPKDPPILAGYKLAAALSVDKLLRNDAGEIIGVQFVDKEGRKVTWEK